MAKRIKMVLYGEPGTGKSVFALGAPKPFFITTDGNYEWLEDFGAKEEDHIRVNSWSEAKAAFAKDYSKYETLVIDLTEDLFKWCEHEYCVRNKLEHISDVGYAKGYDSTRNDFFIEVCKLINLDKHIIFIMHGLTYATKDRRGVEHSKHGPTNRIPDKVLDMIEGRVRYFLRCYLKAEESDDGTLIKKRYLSIVPKENEFGICRGINENAIPHDIPLDFAEFAKVIGLDSNSTEASNTSNAPTTNTSKTVEKVVEEVKSTIEVKEDVKEVKEEVKSTTEVKEEIKEEEVKDESVNESETSVENTEETSKSSSVIKEDKLAAIKAKLAALKKNN